MTFRDCLGLFCGLAAAIAAIAYTGGLTGEPIDIQFGVKLVLVFAAGFGAAWFVRLFAK